MFSWSVCKCEKTNNTNQTMLSNLLMIFSSDWNEGSGLFTPASTSIVMCEENQFLQAHFFNNIRNVSAVSLP